MGGKRESLTQVLNNNGIFFLIMILLPKVLAGATFPKVNFLKHLSHSEACTTENELTLLHRFAVICPYN